MNGLDMALLVLGCILVVVGMAKGLVRILIGFAALIAAFALAARFHEPLGGRLAAAVDLAGEPARLLSYVGIFLGVMLAGGAIAWLTRKLLKAAMLGWADRVAGGALGLLAALVCAALLILPAVAYTPQGGAWLQSSTLAPYVTVVSDLASPLVPDRLSTLYRERVERLRELWRDGAARIDPAAEVG